MRRSTMCLQCSNNLNLFCQLLLLKCRTNVQNTKIKYLWICRCWSTCLHIFESA
uniref:Uncharacterized protein n=1 Tax=Anguilla anguilla TaxID=7936 RepID=A0A0E9U1E5_ANGAN